MAVDIVYEDTLLREVDATRDRTDLRLPQCEVAKRVGATRESVNKWEQQAKSRELRAAMSMARLWRDQGKRHGARDLLAPVYGWFTGDFDTCDLNEAKALLDTLAS